jgi:hypothetical protein
MSEKKSVVTAERFTSGMTYQEYIAQVSQNKERFEDFYRKCELSDDDKAFFKKAAEAPNGAARVMVIGEDWCPDVMRGMPTAARVAEASGMEMRVFSRDKNIDIINEFLKEGKYQSIPVVVFYTADLREICRWIERPGLASNEQAKFSSEIKLANPGLDEQAVRLKMRDFSQAKQGDWQKESVREWRQMLASKLGI